MATVRQLKLGGGRVVIPADRVSFVALATCAADQAALHLGDSHFLQQSMRFTGSRLVSKHTLETETRSCIKDCVFEEENDVGSDKCFV
jgi:hypothetical protein